MTVPLGVELVEQLTTTRNQAEAELEAFRNLRQSYENELQIAYQEVSFLHSQVRLIDKQLDESGLGFFSSLAVAFFGGILFWAVIFAIVMW